MLEGSIELVGCVGYYLREVAFVRVICRATDKRVVVGEGVSEKACYFVQHLDRLLHYFRPNAVSCQHSDALRNAHVALLDQ